MKEFIRERSILSAANVAGVSHGQEFYENKRTHTREELSFKTNQSS